MSPPPPLPAAPTALRARLIVLVAIFWLAQLQGLSHGISHLGQSGRDHALPHPALCADCIASADAGAAPMSVLAVPVLLPAASDAMAAPAPSEPRLSPIPGYRSRAPPSTST